jgi:hypothetical protein
MALRTIGHGQSPRLEKPRISRLRNREANVDHIPTPERRIDRLDNRIFLLAFAIFATGTDAGVVVGIMDGPPI